MTILWKEISERGGSDLSSYIKKNYNIGSVNRAKFWTFSDNLNLEHKKFLSEYKKNIKFIITSDAPKIFELEESGIFPDEKIDDYCLYQNIEDKIEQLFFILIEDNPYTTQTLLFFDKEKNEPLENFITREKKLWKQEFFIKIPKGYSCFVFEWDSYGVNCFFNKNEETKLK